MNGREAVKALMDGKRVRRSTNVIGYSIDLDDLLNRDCPWTVEGVIGDDHGDWSVVDSPLTDEQLIAEWERRLSSNAEDAISFAVSPDYASGRRDTLSHCIRQLRERKL